MGSVKVTVYGRVKPCLKNTQVYRLKKGDHEDQITFVSNKISSGKKTYRFKKIFTENATQEDIFETVAKPIIKSVLAGYNGTIFTYGQTGSGKTYTMTGDLEGWIDPGLIPRTVQEIFRQKDRDTPITVSYCEIYNEHVYDLIRFDRLDSDIPQISLLEDSSGITHFRNLSVHMVRTAFEALQLLIRGDANKMVAETNSNARSSRSHVIFSIGLEFPHPTEEKLCLKPVLYLVDLAGSEKLSKCKTPMNNPLETRYINLSLHYLEQVLIALRQPGRNHIPYRNSLMTALLRNSLGGNCITAMIATFSLTVDDLEETLQTCRFAERIALIKNEVKLNELADPQKEIQLLRKENDKLKAQLKIMGLTQAGEELTDKERGKCVEMVKNFIKDDDIFDLPLSDLKRMEYCFHIMREEILKKEVKESLSIKADTKGILDLPKKKSSHFKLKYQMNEESRVKFIESSGGRKRNPMDLPKINVTYKRWKSTGELAENESSTLKQLSSSKELKAVESNLSESSVPQRKLKTLNSEVSMKKGIVGAPSQEQQKMDTYVLDGCFLKLNDSGIPAKHKESNVGLKFRNFESGTEVEELSKTSLNTAVSSLYMKTDFPGPIFRITAQSPFSSDEKLTCGEIRKLVSVGVQAEETESSDISTDDVSINSNVDANSVNSVERVIFPGKSLPLTGDKEVDEEIYKFYKARYETLRKRKWQ